jgi:Kef-type K+ transport system membrane component KefB/nucleotide-binding universal stress UspA family protein
MHDVTFALAVLLVAGFLTAKLGQLLKLPSVTGYILAGLLLGPSGVGLITKDVMGSQLEHFTQIALMLIAFGIGEHLELKRLKYMIKSIGLIGLCETSGAFLLVFTGTFFVARATYHGDPIWTISNLFVLALLLAAVSVATAPAATLHVMRELKAKGPLTSTLMAVVAVDDALAIMFFGVAISFAHHVLGGTGSIVVAVGKSLGEIFFSLSAGVITGFILDFTVKHLRHKGEMLTLGLAMLLLCGETARLFHFSPLLSGMAAGFVIINRGRRDVRVFNLLHAFEPPILVLFFTLAGAHLHFISLAVAGWIGLSYFLLRGLGKIAGAYTGSRIAATPVTVRRFLGIALIPQAGVAIGLIFLIQSDPRLTLFSDVITPVVLAGVVLSELVGPLCAKFAVERAGEATFGKKKYRERPPNHTFDVRVNKPEIVRLVPWIWEQLTIPENSNGTVIVGGSHIQTVSALARIAALIANYHQALPLAVRVVSEKSKRTSHEQRRIQEKLFEAAEKETKELGTRLGFEVVRAKSVPDGIVAIARKNRSFGIVVGHPQRKVNEYHRVVERVANQAACPVIVARFVGELHTERILVPIIDHEDLTTIKSVLCSLAAIGHHHILLLRLMASGSSREALVSEKKDLERWTEKAGLACGITFKVKSSEALLESIVKESEHHDLLVMAAEESQGLPRLFFGSLSEDVARNCNTSMLVIYSPKT